MRKPCVWLVLMFLAAACLSTMADAADWPTWRCDVNRSAASPEALPDELHLRWVRKFSPVVLAWPNEPRLHFDASYEPVVMGKMLYLGSPNDGSVSVFDTETGEERWKFHTEGPVRFAPVAWEGRVYFGSDDGHLYCLDAAKGSLLWKFRGAPDDRPDRRHLGNARLISFWPIRGGPVLVDGRIYFGAGIWPTLGVFIVALDAGTGRLIWRNGDLNLIEKVRIDHNNIHDTGLSPQGYFVFVNDRLLVPNGRSMPAGLDPKTGKLLCYCQGYRNGDCRVAALGKHTFVGDSGVLDAETGREVGSRWASAGADAPPAFDIKKMDAFEGPFFPYKLFPGCTARSVLAPGMAYGLQGGVFYAYDLDHAATSEYEKEFSGHKLKPWRWDAPELWKLATEHAKKKPAGLALIKAGSPLYGHAGKILIALDIPAEGEPPKIAWTQDLDGTPSSLLAADGKLFVVTQEGGLLCFGAGETEPTVHEMKTTPLPDADDEWTQAAAEILKHANISEGYCLVLGLGSGRLLEELLHQSEAKVIGIDADPAKVHALRDRLVAAGLYGTRAEVFIGQPFDFPFPPYLAGLIVSEDPKAAGFSTSIPARRLFDVLRPYGGVLCLPMQGKHGDFAKWAAKAGLESAEVEQAGDFSLLRRVGPLPGSADWTHETADAARSYFSKDQRVKAPLGILWYGDGSDYGFFKHHDYGTGVKPQVVGGRLFAFQIHSKTLFAYDIYTGRVLWKQKVERFTRYASMTDGIYVAEGDRCVVYDPATGKELKTFTYEVEGKPVVKDIRVSDDLVAIAVAFTEAPQIEKGLWDSLLLVALDRRTGKMLWTKGAKERFNNHAIAIGDGLVFCIDSLSPTESDQAKRKGEAPETAPSTIMALDARTGETKWTAETINKYRTYGVGNWLGIRGNDDWLACCEELGLLLAGKAGKTRAYEADTGKEIWEAGIGGQPMILRGKTFLTQSGALFDAATGKPLNKKSLFQRGGCNYAVGGEHLVFLRAFTASYVDVETEKKHYLRNIRSGCSNSLVAADGLLSVPNFAVGCVCNYPIQTSFAMVHMPEVEEWGER